jgi:hypothetical protein
MLDHATDNYEKISLAFLDGQPSGNLTHEHVPPADTRPLDDPELFLSTSTLADPAVVDDLEDARSQS